LALFSALFAFRISAGWLNIPHLNPDGTEIEMGHKEI